MDMGVYEATSRGSVIMIRQQEGVGLLLLRERH
jgi:hypothetical protein